MTARSCRALLRIARSCSKLLGKASNCSELLGAAWGCWELLEAALACPKAARSCSKLVRTAWNCSALLGATRNCSELLRAARGCSGSYPRLLGPVQTLRTRSQSRSTGGTLRGDGGRWRGAATGLQFKPYQPAPSTIDLRGTGRKYRRRPN